MSIHLGVDPAEPSEVDPPSEVWLRMTVSWLDKNAACQTYYIYCNIVLLLYIIYIRISNIYIYISIFIHIHEMIIFYYIYIVFVKPFWTYIQQSGQKNGMQLPCVLCTHSWWHLHTFDGRSKISSEKMNGTAPTNSGAGDLTVQRIQIQHMPSPPDHGPPFVQVAAQVAFEDDQVVQKLDWNSEGVYWTERCALLDG